MRSTPSLPLLPGSLWSGVVAPNRILSRGGVLMGGGQIELFGVQTECKQLTWAK